MRTVAHKQERPPKPLVSNLARSFSRTLPQLQRACACGGGCPRCQAQQSDSARPQLKTGTQSTIQRAPKPKTEAQKEEDARKARIKEHAVRPFGQKNTVLDTVDGVKFV